MAAAAAIHRIHQKRPRPCRRRKHRAMTPLPMDLLPEIARRTDPATLARCAATCKELRRHITDPSFRGGRLRLRHGERFAPPSSLLRGQLVCKWDKDLYLEETTTPAVADGTNNLVATDLFNSAGNELCLPVAARGGLVLVRVIKNALGPEETIRVCSTITGSTQSLPPGPAPFPGQHVLLVGAVGRRPFKVLRVGSALSRRGRRRSLRIQTFSSGRGAWKPRTSIPVPFETTCIGLSPKPGKHLVVGDAVYWLCRNDNSFYVFKLDVDKAKLTMTKLPPSFHRECGLPRARAAPQVLLATPWEAWSPVVLVANHGRVSAWTMTMSGGRTAARWTDQPRVVVEYDEAMERLIDGVRERKHLGRVRLEWFAERSGVVLLSTPHRGFFWLDLQSGKIIRPD